MPDSTAYAIDQGPPLRIRKLPDGEPFPPDPNTEAYCEFLTWVSEQPEQVAGFPMDPHSVVLPNIPTVVDHFKRKGELLYARAEKAAPLERAFYRGDSRYITRGVRYIARGVPGEALHRLEIATLSSSDGQETLGGLAGHPYNVWVSETLIDTMNHHLQDDTHDIRRVSAWPVRRAFVYIDVSDFSDEYPAGQQALIVSSLTALTSDNDAWTENRHEEDAFKSIDKKLCIGDGYVFCFRDTSRAAYFAARLAHMIEVYRATKRLPVGFHFRVGVHVGPVYHFWDTGRNDWNYVGDGINGGNRVLSAMGKASDDMVYISSDVRDELLSNPTFGPVHDILAALDNRGRHQDKHRNKWRVYVLNHARVQ
jgi:class 3 adenylate cyclase